MCENKYTQYRIHAYTYSAQRISLVAQVVRVEIDISPGIHAFSIIGLPDKAVDEARERVSAAIKHSGFISPKQQNQKIVISLAPGNLKKTGTLFDVPVALTYLLAMNKLHYNPEKKLFIGELALNGDIRPTQGILPILQYAKKNGFEEIYIPADNAEEAKLIDGITIIPCESLRSLIAHLQSEISIPPVIPSYTPISNTNQHIGFEPHQRAGKCKTGTHHCRSRRT